LPALLNAIDEENGYDAASWRRIATELELIGIAVPEEYGGTGAASSTSPW